MYKDARAEILVILLSITLVQSTGSGFWRSIFISLVTSILEPGATLGYRTNKPKSNAFFTFPEEYTTCVFSFMLCFVKPPAKLFM